MAKRRRRKRGRLIITNRLPPWGATKEAATAFQKIRELKNRVVELEALVRQYRNRDLSSKRKPRHPEEGDTVLLETSGGDWRPVLVVSSSYPEGGTFVVQVSRRTTVEKLVRDEGSTWRWPL